PPHPIPAAILLLRTDLQSHQSAPLPPSDDTPKPSNTDRYRTRRPLGSVHVQEGLHFLQPGVTPVAAPAVLSQTFPALNWRSLAQHHSAHRIEMQIAAHLHQIFFGLEDRTLD